MKLFQPIVNWVEFLVPFFSKAVEEFKIPSISNFNDSLKEARNYFENHPVLQVLKESVLLQVLLLEKLISMKL